MPREFRSYRSEAIVLRHSDSGEADRILTLFTRQDGKVRAIAKGVRKIRSRKAGHLEPFTRVVLQLAKSKNMPIITQADTLDAFLQLKQNLLLIGYASYVAELLDKFTYEEGENVSLYNLLNDTFTRLTQPDADHPLTLRYYEMRLLDFVGYRPVLFDCVICGEEVQKENQFFSAEKGGVVCPRCAPGVQGLRPISIDGLRFMRHFQRSSYETAARAAPSADTHREIEHLMQHYITYILERGLNSPKFLREVR